MKKMVCEVCGSTRIKKNNNVFLCQECGIEYSLEDVRKLLVEVDDDADNNQIISTIQKDSILEKNLLLKNLLNWAEIIKIFEGFSEKGIYLKNPWTDDFCFETNYSATKEKFIEKTIDGALKSTTVEYKFFETHLKEINCEYLKDSYNKLIQFYNELQKYTIHEALAIGGIVVVRGMKHERFFHDFDYIIPNRYGVAIPFAKWINKIKCMPRTILIKRDVSGFFASRDLKFDVCDFDKCRLETNRVFDFVYEKYINEFYDGIVNKIILERTNLYKSLILCAKECEEKFYLPVQYRNIESIVGIIKIINDGKADTWKEAVVLYDTETFRKNLLNGIGNMYYALADLKNSIESGFRAISMDLQKIDSKLFSIDQSISNLNLKINETNESLKKIKNYSFINAISSI